MQNTATLKFVKVTAVSAEQLERVREIRNLPDIRTYMYTDHLISAEEHLRWLEGLKTDTAQQVFVILSKGKVVGLVSLSKISLRHKTADWAFYLDPEAQGGGFGVQVEYALLTYAFTEVGLEKLNCEVLETNPKVVQMHLKFGFKEEGCRRSNIVKGNDRVGVHLLGITAAEWHAEKPKFDKVMKKFSS